MSEVIVHVGTPKTGTTVIQHALSARRRALRREGFDYIPHSTEWVRSIARPDQRGALETSAIARALHARLTQREGNRLLLSDEVLYGGYPLSTERLRRVTDGLHVTIILYIRRQDTYAESQYAQSVKSGKTARTFEEWLASLPKWVLDYRKAIDAYQKYFGPRSVIVRRYTDDVLSDPRDIVEDFGEAVGTSALTGYQPRENPNPSLDRPTVEFVRACNERLADSELEILRRTLQWPDASAFFREKKFFRHGQRLAFLEQYIEGNESIAHEFFPEREGILFDPPAETGEWKEPGLSSEDIAALAFRLAIGAHRTIEPVSVNYLRRTEEWARQWLEGRPALMGTLARFLKRR